MTKSLMLEIKAVLKERKWSADQVAHKFAISIFAVEQIAVSIKG